MAKVTGGAASKLAQIKVVRKSIARVLTVYNQTQKSKVCSSSAMALEVTIEPQLREALAGKKYLPKDLRQKKTRAMRRALTLEEVIRDVASPISLHISAAFRQDAQAD